MRISTSTTTGRRSTTPTGQGDDAKALFISDNYVIRLKPNRAGLPEYARFAGLRCEVQVQTILNHAWAQMAHDTIYKKPIERGFGTAIVEGINARLAKVMRDHLLPADYEFQKITSDYRRLLAGKDMFDAGALETIRGCGSLNDLHETIERFGSHVLPNYDDIEALFPDVLDTLVDIAERALAKRAWYPARDGRGRLRLWRPRGHLPVCAA